MALDFVVRLIRRLRPTASTSASLFVVAAAAGASAVAGPAAVRAPLEGLAATIVVGAVVQRSSKRLLDGLLVGVGGVLVALVLMGLLLDTAPGGLARPGWTVSVGVLETVIVAFARPRFSRLPRIRIRPGLIWYLLGTVLVATGLVVSAVSTQQTDRPPLTLSVTPFQGASTTVSIVAGESSGPLRLVESVGATERTLLTEFEVSPAHPTNVHVDLPIGRRVLIRLISRRVTVRELILEGR